MSEQINVIKELLINIKSKTNNGNQGKEFEDQIKNILSMNHFVEASFDEKNSLSFYDRFKKNLTLKEYRDILKNLKSKILDKNSVQVIRNPFKKYISNNIYIYIYQPFGSQNFPDFLLIINDYIFPLEIKFSNKSKNRELPKWNSNIPKSNAIYIFTSTAQSKPIIFLGSDYISNDIRQILINHFDKYNEKQLIKELKGQIESTISDENKLNPFGLYPKIRTDFLTRNDFVFGNREKLNINQFADKMNWFQNVINFLESLEYEE